MRWFTSDLHLGDPWAARMRYCGDDTAKHDAWLASRWDSTIGADDDVWLLGDLSCVNDPESQISEKDLWAWLKARPGRKHVVLGNWDESLKLGSLPVDSIWVSHYMTLDTTPVMLSHYPDEVTNDVLLHGHTHKRVKHFFDDRNRLRVHVGWEAWRRFIPETDLINFMKEVAR